MRCEAGLHSSLVTFSKLSRSIGLPMIGRSRRWSGISSGPHPVV